jgi:TPR repeat protein
MTQPKAKPLSLEEAYWRTIRDSTEIRDFEAYLRNHPDSRFRDLAEARIAGLGRAGEIADFVSDGEVVDRARLRATAMERIDRLPKQFLQYGLIALGFPVADVTGALDAATRRAVRQYQASIGEPQTGRPTAQQTVDLLFAAATVGDAHAETGIGIMVASGYGLTQDYELARMWLGRASSQGNEYAKANLAVLYRDGLGGEKNLDLARSLLSDAYESGLDEAGELLADFPG